MASSVELKIDTVGVGQVLKSAEVMGEVNKLTEQVAANVRIKTGMAVLVDHYTTDRSAAKVTIADLQGMAAQAKNGVLTQSAHEAGLDVKEKR